MATSTRTAKKRDGEKRSDALAAIRELLAKGRLEEALAIFAEVLAENRKLKLELAGLAARRRKNEGVSADQLRLFLDMLDAETEDALAETTQSLRTASGIDERRAEEDQRSKNPPKQPPLRQPAPMNLRRVINDLEVPESERACPRCQTDRSCIGHDVTEVIDFIPAEVVVRVDRREKLACRECESEIVRAPMGDKVVPAGKLGSALVAELLVDKYRDGLPLHRQKLRFERLGLKLPMSTLADQVTWATDLLRPIWHAARDEVLSATVMHLDGTSLPVLDRDSEGGVKLGSLWGYVGGETALYLYASTGKKEGQRPGELGPADILRVRRGYTVADASLLFEESFRRADLIECGCNMHARRYFAKALDAGDKRAALPLAAFKRIYEIEEEARGFDLHARTAIRRERTKPVYDELVKWCTTHQPYEPPSSPLGKAIQYLLNNAKALRRFLEDGVIPPDNGAVERLHVRAALTRKNYLFAGSDTGAERAAIAYTVLACCQLAEVNPLEYLKDVLPRLARGLRLADAPSLLPTRWKTPRTFATTV